MNVLPSSSKKKKNSRLLCQVPTGCLPFLFLMGCCKSPPPLPLPIYIVSWNIFSFHSTLMISSTKFHFFVNSPHPFFFRQKLWPSFTWNVKMFPENFSKKGKHSTKIQKSFTKISYDFVISDRWMNFLFRVRCRKKHRGTLGCNSVVERWIFLVKVKVILQFSQPVCDTS